MMLLLACTEPDEGQSLSAAPGDTSHADSDSESHGDSGGDSGADSGADTGTPPDDGELRGVWVDRWTYASEDDVRSIMAGAAGAGFNAVYFQVRGTADAYYQSSYEPWSSRLSGALGVDPGWDPLGVAVESGHALGMEVHAYINAFPFWSGTTPPAESSPRHAYLEHPEWLVADGSGEPMALNSSYVWMSPGNPEVRQRLADVSRDIADRYAVDGIHVDLVRYPGRDYSFDEVSLSLWDGTDYADWQRARVVEAVLGVQEAVDVPVTASVWGIYEDRWGWGTSQGYHDYYQDSYAFLESGATDANMPMIYWPVAETEGDYTDFTTLVKEFVANRHDRHIYAGVAADLTLEEMLACIESARANGAQGVVIFDYGLLDDNGYLDDLAAGPFVEPREPPRMDWR